MLTAVRTVEPVVARHHGARPGPLDGSLERQQVDLAQRPFIDLRGDRHPLELGVIADEVLDAGGNPLRLHALDVGGGQLRREHGILAHALEVATADRGALEVDRWAKQYLRALGVGLPAQCLTNLAEPAPGPTLRRGRRRTGTTPTLRRSTTFRARRPGRRTS